MGKRGIDGEAAASAGALAAPPVWEDPQEGLWGDRGVVKLSTGLGTGRELRTLQLPPEGVLLARQN